MCVAACLAADELHEREHSHEHDANKYAGYDAVDTREECKRHDHAHVTRSDDLGRSTMRA